MFLICLPVAGLPLALLTAPYVLYLFGTSVPA